MTERRLVIGAWDWQHWRSSAGGRRRAQATPFRPFCCSAIVIKMPNRARKFRTLHKFGKRRRKRAVQPEESSQSPAGSSKEPSGTADWQTPRCSSPTQRQPPIATASDSGSTRPDCCKTSLLSTLTSADLDGRAEEVPRRRGGATQVQPAIAIAAMVVSESADSGDTPSRHQKTLQPLAITTADGSDATKELAAGESVTAIMDAASSTTGMRKRTDRVRIDSTFLTTADRDMIERRAQQKVAELSSVSATDRKMNFLASECSPESASTTTYTIVDLDMVNNLLHEVSSCKVCHEELTIERDAREYGVAVKLKVKCSNCGEVGSNWSSRRVRGGSNNCSPFEMNIRMARAMQSTGNQWPDSAERYFCRYWHFAPRPSQ
ncbi:hypothetical protein HPB49_017444 [Dermacentor silvarum]|uniref:Uncharacterized protein n=1 Tax=Dermacentor silvarum TaxID=543639 RepID=A0ACB8DET2_DERSI|nr:hypothetical protein HPB49_017444 [Dermacentor silvarum]